MDSKKLRERIVAGFSPDDLEMFVAEAFPEIHGGLASIVSPRHDLRYQAFALVERFHRHGELGRLEAAVTRALGEVSFDVALSFAGEDRATAEALAGALAGEGVAAFFDRDFEPELLGDALAPRLRGIYQKARFAVVLVSAHYAAKPWTKFELAVLLEEERRHQRSYLLPLRLDDTTVDGIDDERVYLDLRQRSVAEAAAVITKKVK